MRNHAILLILSIFLFSAALQAHPASEVKANYDKETMILTVQYEHSVSDSSKHFIDDIDITLDKKELVVQKLSSQDSAEGGEAIYKIRDLKPGDVILITTSCNRFGKKSLKYTVE